MKHVAVIGAAGKMGKGITLLLLQAMACEDQPESILHLIDVSHSALRDLRRYLRYQMTRYAERNINKIRSFFADDPNLVSNEEIIQAFLLKAMDHVRLGTEVMGAKVATQVFEAVVENIAVKTELFEKLHKANPEAYFFTNTSSIPISVLNEKAGLDNRIIGFHFYNPPAVQKLVELIVPKDVVPELEVQAIQLAKHLKKTVVRSADVAGFIGNGHFIREILFACQQVRELKRPLPDAIGYINGITEHYLLRPMGIFQLVDYVGVGVCRKIMSVMSTYLEGGFQNELIETFFNAGVLGGQHPDGSQKNGIFQYEENKITGVYGVDQGQYVVVPEVKSLELSWKKLLKDPEKEQKVEGYLQSLQSMTSEEAQLAKEFLRHSQGIVQGLVDDNVAESADDVETVLKNGFYHLYSPMNLGVRDASV